MKNNMETPKHFDKLSFEDQKLYLELQSYLSSKPYRNNRGQRLTKFSEILNAIHQFCIKNDEDDVKRCMVCGVLWLPPKGIAINIRQLHILLDKCKSSINGSLQRMGYNPLPPKNELVNQLIEYIPSLKNNFPELREWTIRTLNVLTPQPEPVSLNSLMGLQNSFQSSSIQNNIISSKVNNEVNKKNLTSSVSMGSFADAPNNGNMNFYSPFSTPQPNIYMNQFLPQDNTNQQVLHSMSFSQEPHNDFNKTEDVISDGINGLEENTFDNDNFFNDPFCLPPTTLFDDEDPIDFPF